MIIITSLLWVIQIAAAISFPTFNGDLFQSGHLVHGILKTSTIQEEEIDSLPFMLHPHSCFSLAFVTQPVSGANEVDISIPEINGDSKILLKGEWKEVWLDLIDADSKNHRIKLTMFLSNQE